ncbi:MAG: bifunctional oligoribonuclease/PAP phosphatase NrnA [Terriglobia bacterium]
MTDKTARGVKAVADVLRGSDEFVVATHVLPDGDGVGALLALGLGLTKLGSRVSMVLDDDTTVPSKYSFLPGAQAIRRSSDAEVKSPGYVFVAVDCADANRLGSAAKVAAQAKKTVNIDHHPGNSFEADVNLVDEEAAASCTLVRAILNELGVEFDKDIATCLYAGIVTDTGRFQYANTTRETLEMAAELLGYGLSPHRIFQEVYENSSFENLKLLGDVLGRAEYIREVGLVYGVIRASDFTVAGVEIEETEYFIDYLRQVTGARVIALAKELDDNSLRVSMRSKGEVDVGKLARAFGGGGHRQAAAFTSTEKADAVLQRLIVALDQAHNAVTN